MSALEALKKSGCDLGELFLLYAYFLSSNVLGFSLLVVWILLYYIQPGGKIEIE
jgi:hypothetical protein